MGDAQLDFLREADGLARFHGYLKQAADRYGIPELARRLKLDESTLRNQLDYRKRQDKPNSFWKANEDCVFVLFFHDRKFREDLLSVTDERIEDVEVISPEDALREIVTIARSGEWGTGPREKITHLYRRVKKGGSR